MKKTDMVKPIVVGKNTRMTFSKIDEVLEMPDLVAVQKDSYRWFKEKGLTEALHDVSPITDYSGNLSIDFVGFTIDDKPKYSVEECKDRDITYSAPLKVEVRLTNKLTGEVKQQEIYMGDFPLMTDNGTFIINGAERVVVSQIVRSPVSTMMLCRIKVQNIYILHRLFLTVVLGWNMKRMQMTFSM
jgi:DNA-directed RNA polymerase subunit beta